ncbi:hypothetical protein CGLO_02181 [Colletotrichum gloeosporioides Cg-14]|uniref:Uncharacterized protein n=1 Tax=Colletotrichum gloeosporioides (strain Cg-14) TaxID=1237896 RepID=T0M9J9_COLGC|nr:hypothetical protein CGLO_02181 [Colletotrichum gloeosporioides Cg-14]
MWSTNTLVIDDMSSCEKATSISRYYYACMQGPVTKNLTTWNVANGCIFVPRNAMPSKSGISKLVLRVNDRAGIQVAGTETTPDVEMTRQYQLQ